MDYFDNVYITSDLHFYHKNICKYCEDTRGQWWDEKNPKLDEMNEYILKQFDALPAGSVIYNLGDVMLNSSKSFNDLKVLVDRMKSNGKKLILIMGNHDRELRRYIKDAKQFETSKELLEAAGFDKVYEYPILLETEKGKLLLSHEPVYEMEQFDTYIKVHGHTHDKSVDADYFNRECENWAMMEEVKKHPELTHQTNLEINTDITRHDKTVEPSDYHNVCWDNLKNIIPIKDVI